MPRNILTSCVVERENCVTDIIEQRSVYLIPSAQVINPSKGGWAPHVQTTVLADSFRDTIHVHGSNVSQSLNIVDVLGHELFRDENNTYGKDTKGFTSMQRVTRLGIFSSSK